MSSRHAHDPDAALLADDDDDLDLGLAADAHNPHSSSTRWRHEESTKFRKHAAPGHGHGQGHGHAHGHGHSGLEPRTAEAGKTGTHDLADFLNSTRVAPDDAARSRSGSSPNKHTPIMVDGNGTAATASSPDHDHDHNADADAEPTPVHPQDGRTVACGPLLNYRRIEGNTWIGSVLIVTMGGGKTQDFAPTLLLRRVGEAQHMHAASSSATTTTRARTNGGAAPADEVRAQCLYSDYRNTFWRFDLRCEMEAGEIHWEYAVQDVRYVSSKKPRTNSFYVPAVTESMRSTFAPLGPLAPPPTGLAMSLPGSDADSLWHLVMFHSCNGFSVGTDEEAWSGPALWNDVMRRHAEVPFHIMIGGGDQIYNDGIRVNGPLRTWTDISNPKKRRDYPFPEKLRAECDDYYLKNYIRWYSTEPFASANGQIAMLNVWDDHDIIDGFGSYVNEFMNCDVFRGIGGCAHKYYMLFQHHLPPPPSTYTSDAPQTVTKQGDGQETGVDQNQLVNVYVAPPMTEPNYILGPKPGPYVAEHSHNIFAKLGARIALVGIDARTERTRHQVNYPETYDLIFWRLREELREAQAAGTPFRHVILLLGIPIAYPVSESHAASAELRELRPSADRALFRSVSHGSKTYSPAPFWVLSSLPIGDLVWVGRISPSLDAQCFLSWSHVTLTIPPPPPTPWGLDSIMLTDID